MIEARSGAGSRDFTVGQRPSQKPGRIGGGEDQLTILDHQSALKRRAEVIRRGKLASKLLLWPMLNAASLENKGKSNNRKRCSSDPKRHVGRSISLIGGVVYRRRRIPIRSVGVGWRRIVSARRRRVYDWRWGYIGSGEQSTNAKPKQRATYERSSTITPVTMSIAAVSITATAIATAPLCFGRRCGQDDGSGDCRDCE